MTDAKPGFGPNSKEPSPMNIVNPNLGQDLPPRGPDGPMSLIKALCTWDKTQSLCVFMNNNEFRNRQLPTVLITTTGFSWLSSGKVGSCWSS